MSETEKDGADVVVLPPLLYLGALVLGVIADFLWGGATIPDTVQRVVLGTVLVVAGVLVMVRFNQAFAASGQERNPRTATPSILSEGIYARSRNPAYVALTLLYVGLALLFDNPWMLLLLIPVLAVMHYGVILREEAYLERKFGEEYLAYKRRVRRWV